jgi:5-methylcytosine-specific restriction endonuclease McrA
VCGRDFKSSAKNSKCCGTECGIAHTIALTRAKHGVENNQCERCGITFSAGKCDGKKRRFCSRICAYAFAKAHPELKRLPDTRRPGQIFCVKRRRSARIAGRPRERVTIAHLIARNGTKCHICGIETDASVRALEPTIDHVIPIALGGAHVLANVKLAHRVCNSLKGDRKLTAKLQRACRDRIKTVKRAAPAICPNLTRLSTMEGDSDGQPEAKALASRD